MRILSKAILIHLCLAVLLFGQFPLPWKKDTPRVPRKVVEAYIHDSVTGSPIPGAAVTFRLCPLDYQEQNYIIKTTATDQEGIAVCEVPDGAYVSFYVVGEKDGCYWPAQSEQLTIGTPAAENTSPVGTPTTEVLGRVSLGLDDATRQVKMYHASFRAILPEAGRPYGVDLTCNDLVEPYGQGRHSHLFLQLDFTEDPVRWWKRTVTLTITFPGRNDAWLELIPRYYDHKRDVILRAVVFFGYNQDPSRLAMSYTVGRNRIGRGKDRIAVYNIPREPIPLRLCTTPGPPVSQPRYNVSPANYACIRKPFFDFDLMVKFEYWMNPTPDDRNLNPMDDVTLVGTQPSETEQVESIEKQP